MEITTSETERPAEKGSISRSFNLIQMSVAVIVNESGASVYSASELAWVMSSSQI